MITYYLIELSNNTFAKFYFEGGTHVTVRAVTKFSDATHFTEESEAVDLFNDMQLFDQHGWGFESYHPECRYHGDVITPLRIRSAKMFLVDNENPTTS